MPKNRPMARADILSALPWKPTSNGMFPGGMIARHSIPGDRISVIALDAITVHAGELKSGTLHSGNRDGAHVSIGDKVYGIQMFNESKQLMFALSWLDGSFRLGLPGKPGVYMQNGDVHIDGSVLVDGTVTAMKIQTAGMFSRIILEEDRILSGVGTWGSTFTGSAIDTLEMAGYNAGTKIWWVDNLTGAIRFAKSSNPNNDYAMLDGDGLTISNPTKFSTTLPETNLRFLSNNNTYGIGLFGANNALVLTNIYSNTPVPSFNIYDNNEKYFMLSLANGSLRLTNASKGYTCYLGERANNYQDMDLCTYGELRLGPEKYDSNVPTMIEIDQTMLNIYGGSLRFKTFSGIHNRTWPDKPTLGSDEIIIWPNPETGNLEIGWNGVWKSLDATPIVE